MKLALRPAPFVSAFLTTGLLLAAGLAGASPQLAWTDQHDGGGGVADDGYCLLIAPDDNLIVGGESSNQNEGLDLFIRKLDRDDGSEIWRVRYEGLDNKEVAISEMTWDSVGQLIVAGYIRGCVG
jgi:hypothetical protein